MLTLSIKRDCWDKRQRAAAKYSFRFLRYLQQFGRGSTQRVGDVDFVDDADMHILMAIIIPLQQ